MRQQAHDWVSSGRRVEGEGLGHSAQSRIEHHVYLALISGPDQDMHFGGAGIYANIFWHET